MSEIVRTKVLLLMLQIKIVRDIQVIQGTLASPASFRQTKQVILRSESVVCPSGFVVRMQCEIPLSGDISPDSVSCLNILTKTCIIS